MTVGMVGHDGGEQVGHDGGIRSGLTGLAAFTRNRRFGCFLM